LTPFGSLGGAHSVGADDSRHGNLVRHRPNAVKLAWHWSAIYLQQCDGSLFGSHRCVRAEP
jgi:hypothetical protein